MNLSYASIDMNAELRFPASVYGLGAGIFFLGYLLFEVPVARFVERQGARLWLGIMLLAWGAAAALMGAVQNVPQFYGLRILLGVAEAGFFPGIIIYLRRWFPPKDRATAIGALAVGLPAANLIGAPVSGWLLQLHWLGISGWRWLFVLEGAPSMLAGVAVLLWLKDGPEEAQWLTPDERKWLADTFIEDRVERAERSGASRSPVRELVILCAIWFLDNMGVYGFNLWLPMMIKKASGISSSGAATVAALPFFGALVAAALVSLSSDRTGERRWHAAMPMAVFGIGLAASAFFAQSLWVAGLMICVAALGLTSGTPAFWTLATETAAGGQPTRVALITSFGALGGFCGPYLVGSLREASGSFLAGLAALAVSTVFAALLILVAVPHTGRPN